MRLGKSLLALMVMFVLIIYGCTPARKPLALKKYRTEPTVTVYFNETGEKKKMRLEEYVLGVVAAEMEPDWPVNALAAQAILARTFALENIESGKVRKLHGTDVSTDIEESQAYDPKKITENVKKAVQMTRGQVVLYKGHFIKAWFNACDGGISASAREGLSYTKTPTPYVKELVKDGCLKVTIPENRHWRVEIPWEEIRKVLKTNYKTDPGPNPAVKVLARGKSGRVLTLRVGTATVGAPALRLALGPEKMRSTLLTKIFVENGKLIMEGKGFGHGVGLCQWGANKMAREGKSPEEIIRFYFKDIEIKKLWR
ncbi:SpoIID/LytB domain-containing protein [Carboxydothermus ferrireducens]|uniref:Stage II sporulation protein D n=1 Tax=Carboxydothermus ferrireducens DSM 11255 TaxID=1119529 RepID=A0ABX2RC52_9THEO|nr:SpoIID/LytB domain-containing protein [Carboxydothermus ferrireducens]NYE57383.1 stage II sporulation protein D [Carboxydothermus ferrireducens DSM 11255]